MRKLLKYLLVAVAVSAVMISCKKDEPDSGFDRDDLIGKWQLMLKNGVDKSADLDYWKFDADGTGSVWVESIGGAEGEQPFDWTLTKDNLVMIHYVGGVPEAPWPYTVASLTSSKMKLEDKSDVLEFDKKR